MPDTKASHEAAQPSADGAGSSSTQESSVRAVWAGDPVPEAQPAAAEVEGSSAEEAAKTPAPKEKPAQKALEPEIESQIESRVQRALEKERERAQKAADEARQRAEADTAEKTRQEIRDLARQAKTGSLEAAEKLVQLQIELHGNDDPAPQQDQRERHLWEEHAKSFGLDPDDKEWADVPADHRLKGINALAVKKTGEKALVEAMVANKAVVEHFTKHYAAEIEAARNDGLAKGGAARLDAGGASTQAPVTDEQLDREFMRNPKDSQLAKLWAAKERRAGRM